jgi:hypothetical protein
MDNTGFGEMGCFITRLCTGKTYVAIMTEATMFHFNSTKLLNSNSTINLCWTRAVVAVDIVAVMLL